jgi:cytochrome c553
MRNSVKLRSMGIIVPPLDHPSLFHRGLGHYAGACSPCHGAPGEAQSPISHAMLPKPPQLAELAGEWNAAELFWIVKHGLKYTGMPAWIAQQRDDEVWAVVAFLQRLPQLSPEEYRRLSRGDAVGAAASIQETAALIVAAGPLGEGLVVCARCHGVRGGGGGAGGFPRLAGQRPEYLHHALKEYALGARPSGVMQAVAAALNDQEMRRLADFYAAAADPPKRGDAPAAAPETLEQGRKIAAAGVPERGVPPCASCHSLDGRAAANPPLYPALAGQYAEYLQLQLQLWRAGARGGGAYAQIMAAAVRGITDDEIRAVSLYYAQVGR